MAAEKVIIMASSEKFELDTAKGVRDIPAEEMILREKLLRRLKAVFERYGFDPLETPTFERMDVLSVKFGAGASSDAMAEVFKFKDQGKRDLGLRFELTLSMCRHIAMNPNTKMPFKRYEIGRVFRDGPIKLGRTREFYQCDVDIVGASDVIADAEIIKLALDVFKELGLKAYVEINNRKLLNGILEYAGVSEDKRLPAIIIIDKFGKIGEQGVREELKSLKIKDEAMDKVLEVFSIKGTTRHMVDELKSIVTNPLGQEGLKEIEDMFLYFDESEKRRIVFNPSLARGLSYYTGLIFEGYLKESQITSSICGGGRYDELIALLLKRDEKIPATGISFGLVPIMEAIKLVAPDMEKTVTKVFMIPIGKTKKEAMDMTKKLRDAGINVDMDLIGRGISKNLNYANSMGIPFVAFIGEQELKLGKIKMRDMKSGKEDLIGIDEAIGKLLMP
jgi:histidyl-tRNA synthetase